MNQRPFGYEPNELPGCSIPRHNEDTELAFLALLCIVAQEAKKVNNLDSTRVAAGAGIAILDEPTVFGNPHIFLERIG